MHNQYRHGAERAEFKQSVEHIILSIPLKTKLRQYVYNVLRPIPERSQRVQAWAKQGADLIDRLKRKYPDKDLNDITLAQIAKA